MLSGPGPKGGNESVDFGLFRVPLEECELSSLVVDESNEIGWRDLEHHHGCQDGRNSFKEVNKSLSSRI